MLQPGIYQIYRGKFGVGDKIAYGQLELKLAKVHWWVPQGEVWRVRAGKA